MTATLKGAARFTKAAYAASEDWNYEVVKQLKLQTVGSKGIALVGVAALDATPEPLDSLG